MRRDASQELRLDRAGAYRDARGGLVVQARIARTGVQTYSTGEEHRPEDEVFAPSSLETYRGAPITIGHPNSVTRDNLSRVVIGYVRSARRDNNFVTGELVILDDATIRKILSGDLQELSAGYTVDLDGNTQRNIKINHVALLPEGTARAGKDARVL